MVKSENTYNVNANPILSNRIIYLSGEINEDNVAEVAYNLLRIIDEDDAREKKEIDYKREPIKLYINSFGGDIYNMWSLVDIIENSKTEVHTYCTGCAMSAAFVIFLAGGKRFASKHSTFMHHQISYCKFGTHQDNVEYGEEMEYMNKKLEEDVVNNTKLTKKEVYDIRKNKQDKYFHYEDALKYGIIDEVLE